MRRNLPEILSDLDLSSSLLPQLRGRSDEEAGVMRAAVAAGAAAMLFNDSNLYGGVGRLAWVDPATGVLVRVLEEPVFGESFPEFAGPAVRAVLEVEDANGVVPMAGANPFFFPCPAVEVRRMKEIVAPVQEIPAVNQEKPGRLLSMPELAMVEETVEDAGAAFLAGCAWAAVHVARARGWRG